MLKLDHGQTKVSFFPLKCATVGVKLHNAK